jgi:hypothetical protein
MESDSYERFKFMEGAVWMGKTCVEHSELLCNEFFEAVNHFNSSANDNQSLEDLIKSQEWLIEAGFEATKKCKHVISELFSDSCNQLEDA